MITVPYDNCQLIDSDNEVFDKSLAKLMIYVTVLKLLASPIFVLILMVD